MLLLTLAVLAQAGQVSMARTALAECGSKVKRADHGWAGLVPSGPSGWALKALLTRKDGTCASEETWNGLVFKGLAPRAAPGTLVKVDEAQCELAPDTKVVLAGVAWTMRVTREVVTLTAGAAERSSVKLDSACWTDAWLGDLDGDAKADLIVSRMGGGFTTSLFLSTQGKVATLSGPVD